MSKKYCRDTTNPVLMKVLKKDPSFYMESMVTYQLDRAEGINATKGALNQAAMFSIGTDGMLLKQSACKRLRAAYIKKMTQRLVEKALKELSVETDPITFKAVRELQKMWCDHTEDMEYAGKMECTLATFGNDSGWRTMMDQLCTIVVDKKAMKPMADCYDEAEVDSLLKASDIQWYVEQGSFKVPKRKKERIDRGGGRGRGRDRGQGRGRGRGRGGGRGRGRGGYAGNRQVDIGMGQMRVHGVCDDDTREMRCTRQSCIFSHPWRMSKFGS